MEPTHLWYLRRNECFACWDEANYAVVLHQDYPEVRLYCEKHSVNADTRMNVNFFDLGLLSHD